MPAANSLLLPSAVSEVGNTFVPRFKKVREEVREERKKEVSYLSVLLRQFFAFIRGSTINYNFLVSLEGILFAFPVGPVGPIELFFLIRYSNNLYFPLEFAHETDSAVPIPFSSSILIIPFFATTKRLIDRSIVVMHVYSKKYLHMSESLRHCAMLVFKRPSLEDRHDNWRRRF